MMHDHLALCIITFLGLIYAFYYYMIWTGKRIEEDELYKDKRPPIEDYETFWSKPEKKVS